MHKKELKGVSGRRAKRITGDFAVNILAFAVYTVSRQIVVFPLLAHRLSEGDYGTLLTVVGFVNVCNALVGGSLNNIRLVRESNYQERGVSGDFQLLCALGNAASAVFAIVLSVLFHLHWITGLLLTAYTLVANYYQYGTAFFRLKLDFKGNFFAYTVSAVSYAAAACLLSTPLLWPAVFLIGELAGLLYTCAVTKFQREPFTRTPLLRETGGQFVGYMLTNLVGNLLTYADRFVIFAAMDAVYVSYYSTASFFGKSASLVMTPIASVLLGYFAQKGFRASRKLFALINGISLAAMCVFLAASQLLAPWVTQLLYPTLYQQSAPYMFLANLGAIIGVAGAMAQPMLLKACSIRWILGIQVLYGVVYICASLALLPIYNLYGFCWAAIIANTVRLLAFYVLGFVQFK